MASVDQTQSQITDFDYGHSYNMGLFLEDASKVRDDSSGHQEAKDRVNITSPICKRHLKNSKNRLLWQ